jgi:hypothetical protein
MMIAHDVRVGPVYGVGVAPLELGMGLGTGDEESVGLMDHNPDGHPNSPTYGHLKLPHLN